MTDWAGMATLAAATLAALLSGVSLVVSGRREDRQWKREVLRETMVTLFDASFGSVDSGAYRARKANENVDWRRERALDSHAAQMKALTRLRFLANREVVERAIELHDIEDEIYSAVFGPLVVDQPHWDRLIERRWAARSELFNASRRNLGLRRTLPVRPSIDAGPTYDEMARHEMLRQRSSDNRSVAIRTYKSGYRTTRARPRPSSRQRAGSRRN